MELAGLASDHGRALEHLFEAAPDGAAFAVVAADAPEAPVLDRAADRGIPTAVLDGGDAIGAELEGLLADHAVDLVCLDGFTPEVPAAVVEAGPPFLEAHPSLLPAFPGDGSVGAALETGVTVTGCTVYERSTDGVGAIRAQEPVPIHAGDDVDALAERIFADGVRRAYPRAIRSVSEGRAEPDDRDTEAFPDHRLASDDHLRDLRYGENPHQAAAVYRDGRATEANVVAADQRNPEAKALSYNNYNDAAAAVDLIREFDEPAAAVIKHTNPAGCAVAETVEAAYDRALRTDPMSAFGGIVVLNRECDAGTATRIVDSFKEVVVAPAFTDEALATLGEKSNLRVLAIGPIDRPTPGPVERPIAGGRLVQSRDVHRLEAADLEIVTEREPTPAELETMSFAWPTVKHVKSNAVVFATGTETVGIGMGQVSRVDAVRLAAMKADEHAEGKAAAGAVMASDAFFPFPDGIEVAAEAGIEAVIQPGGSVNDEAVIEAADGRDLAMVFTGVRAFRHG